MAKFVLHFPDPMGGLWKAFDMPLSRPMLRCLWRGRLLARERADGSASQDCGPALSGIPSLSLTGRPAADGFWARQAFRTREDGVVEGELALLSAIDDAVLSDDVLAGLSGQLATHFEACSATLTWKPAQGEAAVISHAGLDPEAIRQYEGGFYNRTGRRSRMHSRPLCRWRPRR